MIIHDQNEKKKKKNIIVDVVNRYESTLGPSTVGIVRLLHPIKT